jgi:CspA family cold shock protein
VAWFNRVRGFGFIVLDSGGPDLFVHMEHVRDSGMLNLRPRQRVLVRWGHGPKGAQAVAVRPEVRGDA